MPIRLILLVTAAALLPACGGDDDSFFVANDPELHAVLESASPVAGDLFGLSVDVDGNTLVVGAPLRNGDGEVTVFVRSGGTWAEEAVLAPPSPTGADSFGFSVAVSGDMLVVGAPQEDGAGTDSGAAYVFVRVAGAWAQEDRLEAAVPAAGDLFGRSVDLDGDTVAVGSVFESGTGAAYAFVRTAGVWNQEQRLTASNAGANDLFGYSVSVSGDTLVAGAIQEDGGAADGGALYVYFRVSGIWIELDILRSPNPAAGDLFGHSVSIDIDLLIVGAPMEDTVQTDSGAAYVYERVGGNWTFQGFLKALQAGSGDQFGFAVAIAGERVVVGSPFRQTGSAVVINRRDGWWWFEPLLEGAPPSTDDRFGFSVAAHGPWCAVGAIGTGAGVVSIFRQELGP